MTLEVASPVAYIHQKYPPVGSAQQIATQSVGLASLMPCHDTSAGAEIEDKCVTFTSKVYLYAAAEHTRSKEISIILGKILLQQQLGRSMGRGRRAGIGSLKTFH